MRTRTSKKCLSKASSLASFFRLCTCIFICSTCTGVSWRTSFQNLAYTWTFRASARFSGAGPASASMRSKGPSTFSIAWSRDSRSERSCVLFWKRVRTRFPKTIVAMARINTRVSSMGDAAADYYSKRLFLDTASATSEYPALWRISPRHSPQRSRHSPTNIPIPSNNIQHATPQVVTRPCHNRIGVPPMTN